MPINDQLTHLVSLEKLKLDGLRFRLFDAKGQILGRAAAFLSHVLQGKDKPIYSPGSDCGDVVVVINAAHVQLTGQQWKEKRYRWHSGFPGGLTDISAAELWERDPTRLLSWAIYGMLPRNRARKYRMLKLKLFPEEKHPFGDFELLPLEMPYRAPQDKRYGWLLPDGFLPVNKRLYAYRTMTSKLKWETQKPVVDFSDLLMEDERRALGLSARGGSAGNGAEPQVLNLSKRAAAAAAADGESFGGSS